MNGRRDRRTMVVVTVLAATAGLVLAGIASGALKTKKAEVSVAPGTSEAATAKCKQGTRAVSGGFDAPPLTANSSEGSYVQTFASLRSAKREWTSTATNYFSVPESGTLSDFAYCSDQLPKLKTKSKSTTIPNNETESVTARCPKGGEAVSGGFDAENDPSNFNGNFPLESRRVGKRKWKVTANSFSPPDGADITVYAYCAKHEVGLSKKKATTSTSSQEENITAKARCKKGQQAISGGFGAPVDGNSGTYVEPFESRRAGKRGWKAATGAYADAGSTVDWSAFVYCLDKQ